MNLKLILFTCITVLFTVTAEAQSGVAINATGSSADPSAILDVSSSDKGLLVPRLTSTERDAITSPATGLFIFNTTLSSFQVNIGTTSSPAWSTLSTATSASFWGVSGNSGTNSSSNFIGTTDNVGLSFRTKNTRRMYIDMAGNVGIGLTSPAARLDIIAPAGTNPLKITGVTDGTNTSTDSILTISSGVVKKLPTSTFLTATAYDAWELGGNNVASAQNFGTTSNYDLPFVVNNAEAMRITTSKNVGIGITAPTSRLHVFAPAGTNPLTLIGVSAGTNTSTDSVLTISSGIVKKLPASTFSAANTSWDIIGNSGTNSGANFLGTSDKISLRMRTNNIERMVVDSLGRVGIGVTNPTNPLTVKDTLEIKRTGALSELLFSNTASSGDFRIGSDGGDIFWQGGGGRNLQMGSYWATILTGDRQSAVFPSFSSGTTGTSVIVQSARDASVSLGVQANSATQSANLTEWRNSSGSALSVVDKSGNFGIGITSPTSKFHVFAPAGTNPLTLIGVTNGTNTSTDSVLTISSGIVKKLPASTFLTATAYDAWELGGNSVPSAQKLGTTSNFDLPIITNGTEVMRLTTSNNVGIGTTSPAYRLHVVSPSNPLYLGGVQTGAGTDSIVTILNGVVRKIHPSALPSSGWSITGNSGTNSSTNFIGTTDGQPLIFKVNGTQAGYLGVSGSSYATAFGVGAVAGYQSTAIGAAANANVSNQSIAIGYNATGSSYQGVTIGANANTANVNNAIAIGYNTDATSYQSIAIGSGAQATTNNQTMAIGVNAKATGAQSTAIGYNAQTTQSNTILLGDAANSSLNVGIGTSTPSQKLDVNGNFRLNGAFMPNNSAGTAGYFLQSNGANTPPTWVSINSSGWNLTGNSSTNPATNFIGTTDAKDFVLRTNNVEKMRISSAGNVGIGTNSPNGKLHVYESSGTAPGSTTGSIVIEHGDNGGTSSIVFPSKTNRSSDYGYISYADNGSGNTGSTENSLLTIGVENDGAGTYQDDIAIMPSGNLGVGTNAPKAKMDVNGTWSLGAKGTANTNLVSFQATIPANTTIDAGTIGFFGSSFSAGVTDVTVTIPSSSNYLTSTRATVSVSPSSDLPISVAIASARLISTSQVKIRFLNSSTSDQSISGKIFYITVTEF